MKRKYIGLIVFTIIISCLFIGNISAEEYKCRYTGARVDPDWIGDLNWKSIILTFDTESNKITHTIKDKDGDSVESNAISMFESHLKKKDYTQKKIIEMSKGKCPSKVVMLVAQLGTDSYYYYSFGDTLLIDDEYVYNKDDKINCGSTLYGICRDEKYCIQDGKMKCDNNPMCMCTQIAYPAYNYDSEDHASWVLDEENSDRPGYVLPFACKIYKQYSSYNDPKLEDEISNKKEIDFTKYGYKILYNYYDTNCKNKKSNSTCIKIINAYNDKLSQIKEFCRMIISSDDYAGTCMSSCLNLQQDIYDLTNKDDGKRDCFMSDQIIAFIYNILKWVKYIAPVLVIILGILDFVKALAAQDDDAMKKAQGKFVKRLIAAVLLFLLPLIIDYVLSVFHLVNDSCNINKIF